jgi:E3 ubiquitin-protein ligase HUWE1
LIDSFRQLNAGYKGKAILGHLHVQYKGMPGIDAGGLTRDWYTRFVTAVFDPNYVLFRPTEHGRSYLPNKLSRVNPESLSYFELAGRVIARALVDDVQVDAHLTPSFLKQLLQKRTSFQDVQDVSAELYENLRWILDDGNDPATTGMTMSYTDDQFGKLVEVDLVPNGRTLPLTRENRAEFVCAYADVVLRNEISEQTEAFKRGFYEIIPIEEIRMFQPDELDLVICGVPEITTEDLVASCNYRPPYSATHPVIQTFSRVLAMLSNTERARLLWFVTGSSQLPVGGLRNIAGRSPLVVGPAPAGGMPISHTCFHQLDLPPYTDDTTMHKMLLLSMKWGDCFDMG